MSSFISRPFIPLLAALLLGTALVASPRGLAAGGSGDSSSSASHHPDLDYLKAVNSVAPPRDPELLFLLMAEYSNANLQGEGTDFSPRGLRNSILA
jgi:hypothetical protein